MGASSGLITVSVVLLMHPTALQQWVSAERDDAAHSLRTATRMRSTKHLQYMSFFDPPPCATMASWINLLHSESVSFAATTWARCHVPSLVTLTVNGTNGVDPAAQFGQGASLICSEPCPRCGHDSYFLCDGWQGRLVNLGKLLRPHMATGAIAGIFVGDELLHMNLGYDNLVNLSQALRTQFPKPAVLYGNFEGSWITNDKLFPRVPLSWDLVSADEYWNANHTDDHTAGWPLAGEIYSLHLLPKMAPHQKALLVPGTFASPATLADDDTQAAAQLQQFFAFALNDIRIVGFSPWHFGNRSGAENASSTVPFVVGAEGMPKTLDVLRTIGRTIVAESPHHTA